MFNGIVSRREFLAAMAVAASPGVRAADDPDVRDGAKGPRRVGKVRVVDHSLVDDGGPFLGLGVSYFSALWRCKWDRPRLESDLAFLAGQGFNFYRMLSMVGHNQAWEGREIAPVSFTTRKGMPIDAWTDYVPRFRDLIDLAHDRFGLRTQITVFADAQLMPDKTARIEHMRRILTDVVPGREHKILLIEVANEAWQNGFPGASGVADLREFATFLKERTTIPIAITSHHEEAREGFDALYAGHVADLATWHFSRDRRTDEGWKPVYDCWEFGDRDGFPPVSSNEPIGPGSSVNAETEPIKLVMAAAFAYVAKLPIYVFHCQAGVFGRDRFEDTPAIDRFKPLLQMLPADLPGWTRNDGTTRDAPFTVIEDSPPGPRRAERKPLPDGCVRNTGSRKDDRFVCIPIGIRPGGLTIQARRRLKFTAHDPLTGEPLKSAALSAGESLKLPQGPGALILSGHFD